MRKKDNRMILVLLCTIFIGLCSEILLIYAMVTTTTAKAVCMIGMLSGCGFIAVGSYGMKLSYPKEELQKKSEIIITRGKEILFLGGTAYAVSIVFLVLSITVFKIDYVVFWVLNIGSAVMMLLAFWSFAMYREERIIVFEEEIWIYDTFGKIRKVNKSEIERVDLYHNQNCYHFFNSQNEELFRMSLKMKGADVLIENVVKIHMKQEKIIDQV